MVPGWIEAGLSPQARNDVFAGPHVWGARKASLSQAKLQHLDTSPVPTAFHQSN